MNARAVLLGGVIAGLLSIAGPVQAETDKHVIDTVNGVIQRVEDGQLGYTTAAEQIKDVELKRLFEGYARQRAGFAEDLQRHLAQYGGEPKEHGTVLGAAHRGWIHLKDAATRGDGAILEEVIRGEEEAVKTYEEALREQLPSPVQVTLQRQKTKVEENLKTIKQKQGSLQG